MKLLDIAGRYFIVINEVCLWVCVVCVCVCECVVCVCNVSVRCEGVVCEWCVVCV